MPPEPSVQPDLSNVDSINNLDTARMALRWALEKLHALEKAGMELNRKVEQETKSREHAEKNIKDLQQALALRSQENSERELYYAKLEEYLSLKLAGQLDASALAKRELGIAQREEFLQDRQTHLEKEFAGRRDKLEREYQRLKFELEQQIQTREQREQEDWAKRRKSLDQSYGAKMAEIAEAEVRLKAQEKALSERKTHFEEFCRTQRAELEADIRNSNQSVEDRVQFRLSNAEKFLSHRHSDMESVWTQEKTVLLAELGEWREKAQEHLPRLLEAEKKAASLEESARHAEVLTERHSEEKRAWERDREKLLEELRSWREERSAESLSRILDLEKSLGDSLEASRRLQEELSRERTRRLNLEERDKALETDYQSRRKVLEAEHRRLTASLERRRQEVDELESVLAGRFQEVEERLRLRDEDWRKREETLLKRDRDSSERLAAWQSELSSKAQNLEVLKEELLEAIRSYKAKRGGAEGPESKSGQGGGS